MTEPADAPKAADNSPPPGEPDEVLDTFKADADGADNETVHDAIGGRPRLNWSPVTDGGGRAPTESTDERSSFHFDLGGALARLGDQPAPPSETGPAVEPVTPRPSAAEHALPQRAPLHDPPICQLTAQLDRPADRHLIRRGVASSSAAASAAAPTAASAASSGAAHRAAAPAARPVVEPPETVAPPLEPLPRRGERPAPDAPAAPGPVTPREPASGPYVTARRSVFDDSASAPGTTLPPSVRAPSVPIVPLPPAAGRPRMAPGIPTLPTAAAGADAADVAGRRPARQPDVHAADRVGTVDAGHQRLPLGPAARKPPAAPRQDVQPHDARHVVDRRPRCGGTRVRPPVPVPDRVGPIADPDRRRHPERARRRVRSHGRVS